MYGALYGPESYTTAHGGLGAIKQYILEDGQVTQRITADPWQHRGNDHRLELMTAALLTLANRVATQVELPIADLVEFGRMWGLDP